MTDMGFLKRATSKPTFIPDSNCSSSLLLFTLRPSFYLTKSQIYPVSFFCRLTGTINLSQLCALIRKVTGEEIKIKKNKIGTKFTRTTPEVVKGMIAQRLSICFVQYGKSLWPTFPHSSRLSSASLDQQTFFFTWPYCFSSPSPLHHFFVFSQSYPIALEVFYCTDWMDTIAPVNLDVACGR